MLLLLTAVARALEVLLSVAGIGLTCGTAFVCATLFSISSRTSERLQMAFYCVLCVAMTAAFTWMLLNVANLP